MKVLHSIYNMGTLSISDMITLSPWACGPHASGVHFRQTTHDHVANINYATVSTLNKI